MKHTFRAELRSAFVSVRMHLMIVLVVASVGLIRTSALARYGIAAQVDYALIPLIFSVGSRVLSIAGTHAGAKNIDHMTHFAWIGALVGGVMIEAFGVLAAIFPVLWIGFFSADPDAVETGVTYLQISGPFYGAVGIALILGFSTRRIGRPAWQSLAGAVRLLAAGGLSWVAMDKFRMDTRSIFFLTSSSSAISAAVFAARTASGKGTRKA